MLSPVKQIGTPSPQIPLALLRQLPADDDWLHAESTVDSHLPATMPDVIPLAFLRLVVSDDELRRELASDPAAALARHGIRVDPEWLPAQVKLPDSESLQEALRASASDEDESSIFKYMGFFGPVE